MLITDFNTRCRDKLIRVTYTLDIAGPETVTCTRIDTTDALTGDPIELMHLADYARVTPEEMVQWLRARVREDNDSYLVG